MGIYAHALQILNMKLQRYLEHLIETEAISLVEFSRKSGIDNSVLSKIIRGKRACGGIIIGQLLTALNREQQQIALQYWLMDQIPVEFPDLVTVDLLKRGKQKDERLAAGTLEGALHALGKEAETNAAVRGVIMNMAKAFTKPAKPRK